VLNLVEARRGINQDATLGYRDSIGEAETDRSVWCGRSSRRERFAEEIDMDNRHHLEMRRS
jgi:hypothetical protein